MLVAHEVFNSVIDEIKSITATAVAKKQDAAKLNYPKILEKIKVQAGFGLSECSLSTGEMNEYDKVLLEKEGFKVRLEDKPREKWMDALNSYNQTHVDFKVWIIRW